MGRRNCCVTGCKSTSETHSLYRFPKDKDLRKLWMSYLVPQNSSLLMLTEDQLSNRTVCQLHFERRMFDAHGVRLPKAYPCLFSKDEISQGVPLVTGWNLREEHNYCLEAEDDKHEDKQLMSPESYFILRPEESVEHLYLSTEKQVTPETTENQYQSTEKQVTCSSMPSTNLPSTSGLLTSNLFIDKGSYSSDPIQNRDSVKVDTKHKVLSAKRKMSARNRRLVAKIINVAKDSIGNNSAMRTQEALNLPSELINEFHKLNNHTKTFIIMQLKSIRSGKGAQRYNLEEKLLCLTLLKQSRKSYNLLKHMFSLPSQRTLNRLSEKIIFNPGVNENILAVIKERAKNWNKEKRLCSIVFDEVSINAQLTFNEEKDVIYGFCDFGGERKKKYCDHALVIMIRGVCSSWRQPLAYYFCEGTTAAAELKRILKEIVEKVAQCGLVPLALICDQGSTFRTAVNQFRQETVRQRTIDGVADDGTIHISGHDVSTIYDPPHLIKGIRNNFLTKNISFGSKMATWSDIVAIYNIDISLGHSRALPKLTKQHIDKDSMRKMRVSVATQVLSARVAAMLRYTDAVVKCKDGGSLSPTMATTADVVEFFDELFDSVNGRPGENAKGKLRTAVKISSKHLSFWAQAIKKLSELKFIDKDGKNAYVPSIRGWITTLESFIRIAKLLFFKYEIPFFYPRYLNQDPLENFFGRLRANNYRNVIPDANAFIYTFKSLVLSNVLSPISKFANCEEDEGDQLLTLELLFEKTEKKNVEEKDNIFADEDNKENIAPNVPIQSTSGSSQIENLPPVVAEKVKVHCSAYVAGYLCRKLYKNINCYKCQKTLVTREISSIHKYIMYREYKNLKRSNLAYPTEKFLRLYRQCSQIVHNYLNKCCFQRNVGFNLKRIFENQCNLEWMGCLNHKEILKQIFYKLIIRIQVHNWVKIINKIFRGAVEEKYVKKMGAPQMEALLKFNKTRRKSKIKI